MSGPVLVSYVALWVVVVVMAVALFALYHHFGEMYLGTREGRSSQGPAMRRALRPLEAVSVAGTPVSLPRPGSPALLVFADTGCKVCSKLRPDLVQLRREWPEVDVVAVCGGTPDDVRAWAAELDGVPVVPDPGNAAMARYRVGLSPFAVAVDATGVVRSKGVASTREGLDGHLEAALAPPPPHGTGNGDHEHDDRGTGGREVADESLAPVGSDPHQ